MIIGLTGGIASGKSTVSNMIKEVGIPVVDADVIAREVVEVGEEAYNNIIHVFGIEILNADETIDRKKLGSIVFQNEEKRKILNEIVHPAIRKRMLAKIKEFQQANHRTIVLDIPLLFESKLTYMVDKIVLVYVDQEIQKERLKNRDRFTDDEAEARLNSQMPLIEKIELADEIIHNHGLREETKQQLITILKKWNCL